MHLTGLSEMILQPVHRSNRAAQIWRRSIGTKDASECNGTYYTNGTNVLDLVSVKLSKQGWLSVREITFKQSRQQQGANLDSELAPLLFFFAWN
jgi:hypothetical protein